MIINILSKINKIRRNITLAPRRNLLSENSCLTGESAFNEALKKADQSRDLGDCSSAVTQYRHALTYAPYRTDIKIQLGNMLKDSGRLIEAQDVYQEALKEDPLNGDIHLQLGHVLKLMGRRAAARASYQEALKHDKLLASAQLELAEAGDSAHQLAVYEQQMRAGGAEAMISVRRQLDYMTRQLEHLRAMLPHAKACVGFPIETYAEMRDLFDIPGPGETDAAPAIAIVLLADQEPLLNLHLQIRAVYHQTFQNWQLKIIGSDPRRREIARGFAARESRVEWIEADQQQPQSVTEMKCAQELTCDWVLLLSRNAILHREALAWVAATVSKYPCEAVIFDEEIEEVAAHGANGLRPIFRQAVDKDSLMEANIYGHNLCASRVNLSSIALGADLTSTAACRSYILLNLASRASVAHIPLPLARRSMAAEGDHESAQDHKKAVHAFVRKTLSGKKVNIHNSELNERALRIDVEPDAPAAEIAVIIPTKNNSQDVTAFVRSLLSLAASPENLEILILNNGGSAADDQLLAELLKISRVRIEDLPEPFNWARFNNIGVEQTTAPYLVFANDDMVMLTEGWDLRIRSHLERSDVGAVGVRLLYPDETVQHAGVLFNWKGSDIHDGLYQPADAAGPTNRWHLTRSVSAVTGAFLATARDNFNSVGGFDADFPVAYSDFDYALKVRAAGFRVVWTPHVCLHHYESKTRGLDHLSEAKEARNHYERKTLEEKWPGVLDREPSLNPFWHQATLPFRLLSFPSEERIWAHIECSARINPWAVKVKPL